MQFQYLIDHAVDRAVHHQVVEHAVFGDRRIRLVRIVLENHLPFAGEHFVGQHFPVVAIRAVEVIASVASGDLIVVSDKNRARDAPVGRVGLLPYVLLAQRVIGPMTRQPFRKQKIRRQRMKIALPHQRHALGERRDHGADDFGARLLIRLV